jgi:hypothetical protein
MEIGPPQSELEDLEGSPFDDGGDDEEVKRIFRITLLARNRLGLELSDTHRGFFPANEAESDAGIERTAGEMKQAT